MTYEKFERICLVSSYLLLGQSIAYTIAALSAEITLAGMKGFAVLLFFSSVAFSWIIWFEFFNYLIPFIRNGENKDGGNDRQTRE